MTAKKSTAADLGIQLPEAEVRTCPCGCGERVAGKATYRPGHDARHAGQIGAAIAADPGKRDDLLARLGSPALRSKALAKADRLIGDAAKKSAKEHDGATLKARRDDLAKVRATA